MADKDLSRKPHSIRGTERVWWYEEPRGICIVTNYLGSDDSKSLYIPWSAIRAALARKEKEPTP